MRQRPRVNRCASARRDRAVNVLASVVLTAGAATAVLLGPDAQAGPDRTDRGPAYPAGAAATHFQGLAFDTCVAPTAATMRSWLKSPYRAIGVYVSGTERACKKQPNLTREWVSKVSAAGWKLMPIDVGRQSPCRANTRKRAIVPERAEAQGVAAAKRAINASAKLGILPGSALYTDIEFYRGSSTRCVRPVAEFVSGWTKELHKRGYLAGMYSHVTSGTLHAANRYFSPTWTRPDAVWTAQWDGEAEISGWRDVPDTYWANRQRIKQYRGDHLERHGGVALNIDSNLVDAPVATVASQYPVVAGGTSSRRTPDPNSARVGTLVKGGTAAVLCQVRRREGRWLKLTDGSYLPAYALATGSGTSLQGCAYPAPVRIERGAVVRSGPGTEYRRRDALPLGTLAWVECRHPTLASWLEVEDDEWLHASTVGTGGPTGAPLAPCEKSVPDGERTVSPATGRNTRSTSP